MVSLMVRMDIQYYSIAAENSSEEDMVTVWRSIPQINVFTFRKLTKYVTITRLFFIHMF